jgi:hypothetical protein
MYSYVCGEHTVELGLCIDDLKALRNLGDRWCLRQFRRRSLEERVE